MTIHITSKTKDLVPLLGFGRNPTLSTSNNMCNNSVQLTNLCLSTWLNLWISSSSDRCNYLCWANLLSLRLLLLISSIISVAIMHPPTITTPTSLIAKIVCTAIIQVMPISIINPASSTPFFKITKLTTESSPIGIRISTKTLMMLHLEESRSPKIVAA